MTRSVLGTSQLVRAGLIIISYYYFLLLFLIIISYYYFLLLFLIIIILIRLLCRKVQFAFKRQIRFLLYENVLYLK